ncbi:methyl-accepting chemotaxis protein [Curvibacter lanceolatus]|uniref:methyl-accepting chemotaxis protein n=1 Tax=Curvibacter lanceolatus TaxID=86182 RepID=UPI00036A5536|nr:methyl-accepting chemotaxis protein [Curvibacter lanceolatus]
MNLRDIKTGTRLGLGFALILGALAVLLAGALISNSVSRDALLQTLSSASMREDLAQDMRRALLSSAVSVRNMGLQTKVEAVQSDEAEAKNQRAAYLAAKAKLEANSLSPREREIFGRLMEIDRQMDTHFKEAVDLAAQFNTEQAGNIITGKIDPLLLKATAELGDFIALQKLHTTEVTEQTNASNQATVTVIVVAGVIVLGIAALLAWRLTISITQPLQVAMQAIGQVAAGDLTSPIEVSGRDEGARMLASLQDMRDGLARMVREVRAGAESISDGTHEIASGNADLSHRTEAQASNLEETASSMQDLGNAVKSNAHTARQANEMAGTASQSAEQGGEVVGRVVATMDEISHASRKIADIIGVIDGIAFQTNILALNAAVEAARAGEQGRGFAVVASEVRSLAGRSAEAAREIKSLITASAERVELGSRLVTEAGTSIQSIVAQVRGVAEMIHQISVSADSQTGGIDQVNHALGELDSVTQQNAALVEEAAAAADSLNRQAARMVQAVSAFKLADQGHPPLDSNLRLNHANGAPSPRQVPRLT